MDKIVIFGATGNIGAYFVDYCNTYLGNNYEIIAVGRKSTEFFNKRGIKYLQVDLNNPNDFKILPRDNIYAVVNLAGLLPAYLKEYNPFDYVETNINGALRILEYARNYGADRILYTQTWSVQGGYWGKRDILSPTSVCILGISVYVFLSVLLNGILSGSFSYHISPLFLVIKFSFL